MDSRGMRTYIQDHLGLYLFVAVLFVTGVVFGAVMVNALTLQQKQELNQHLGNFFITMSQGMQMNAKQSFSQNIFVNLKWLGLLWLFGISVIGLPFILVLDFIKGVLIGFTIGFMVDSYAWKGMLFALVSVIPQNLFILPAMIVCSVTALSFGLNLIKHRFLQQGANTSINLFKYSATTFAFAAILAVVSLYEAVLSPVLIKWVAPMLT